MRNVRNIAFTAITTVLVPLLFFVLLEFGLIIAGVGKSYDFFLNVDIDGEHYFQENPDFADQFYPESLDIRPRESTFAAENSADTIRVYILGGSAALGFPHDNHGLDRLLEAQLRAMLPAQNVEIINTAMTSVNSHVVYAVANSIPANSADYAVILMGNNEVVGPYGPGTLNKGFLESISVIRSIQALKRTRIGQSLSALVASARSSDAREELRWQGMQMFSDQGIAHDDPRMDSVYGHYADNLTSIIDTLQGKGIHVVLSSVPVNVRHSAPFLSEHGSSLTSASLENWRTLNLRGIASEANGNLDDAVNRFKEAIAIDPDYADTHFRLASVLERKGDFDAAKLHYQKALDLDALRFRADTKINEIVGEVAHTSDKNAFSFVDSVEAFERAGAPVQPGWNLFLEHVHFSFSGNHVLATELAGAIARNANDTASDEALPPAEVVRRVGFPNYDTYSEIQTLQEMIKHPPFPGQSNYPELQAALNGVQTRVTRALGAPEEIIRQRETLVSEQLADWKIHFELAVLHERLGNRAAMYRNLNSVLKLYPHNRETYMKLAEAKSNEGQWLEVIGLLEKSLHYARQDAAKVSETLVWLGVAHLRRADFRKATELLSEVIDEYPGQSVQVLRAYGQLVSLARKRNALGDLDRYARGVQRYARTLIESGKADDLPGLNQRVAQILVAGGYVEDAREWAQATE